MVADMSIKNLLKISGAIFIGAIIGASTTYYVVAKERGSALRGIDARASGFSVRLDFGDPLDCVINEVSGSAVCDGSAPGTPLRDVWRQLGEARKRKLDNLERAEKAEHGLQEAGREIANLRSELNRFTDKNQAMRNFLMLDDRAERQHRPYLTSPGNTVTAFREHISIIYRRPNNAEQGVILSSNLWKGEIDLEFGKFHRAALREPGIEGEVEISATPAPVRLPGDKPINLNIRPIGAKVP